MVRKLEELLLFKLKVEDALGSGPFAFPLALSFAALRPIARSLARS